MGLLGLTPSVAKKIPRKYCWWSRGYSMALLRGKWTVVWKCWSNPSSTCNEKLVIPNKLFCTANKSMTPEDHLISSTSVSNNLKLSLKSSQWMNLRCSWTLKWIIFEEKMKWSDCWNNSWKCNRILKSSNDDWTETGWTFARNVGTSVELEPVNLSVARAVV